MLFVTSLYFSIRTFVVIGCMILFLFLFNCFSHLLFLHSQTPLHFASFSCDQQCLELMLHAGADRTLKNVSNFHSKKQQLTRESWQEREKGEIIVIWILMSVCISGQGVFHVFLMSYRFKKSFFTLLSFLILFLLTFPFLLIQGQVKIHFFFIYPWEFEWETLLMRFWEYFPQTPSDVARYFQKHKAADMIDNFQVKNSKRYEILLFDNDSFELGSIGMFPSHIWRAIANDCQNDLSTGHQRTSRGRVTDKGWWKWGNLQ